MSLKHTLLGFLSYGPMTGYQLKKLLGPAIGHFWNAELSQIYPTLKQMESEDLAEMKVEVQADKPNRKVYSITDDGVRELSDWLAQPAAHEQVRDPLMIKVCFGSALSKQQLTAVLRHRADELRQLIEDHEQARATIHEFAEKVSLPREAFFWELTVDAGVREQRAAIEWIEEAVDRIERLDDSYFEERRAGTMDVDRALEILEKLQAAMPEAFARAQAHHASPGQEPG